MITALVLGFFNFSIYYYLTVNSIYLLLLVTAYFSIREHKKTTQLIDSLKNRAPVFAPPISILAPAFNEEKSIVDSARSFLKLAYPRFEILIINDGSKDETLSRLIQEFRLEKVTLPHDPMISKTEIRGTYRSPVHPNLVVIDKANGGKADALNVGISYASHDLLCNVDSDSVLEEEALFKVAIPFIRDPERTIASGGTIRVINGCTVKRSTITKVALPRAPIALAQVVEYTRAFLCGRVGWNAFNATLVISGAFGLFKKSAVVEVGGYLHGSVGEDMELVVRLHERYRTSGRDYSIVFIPDPVCWTEVPDRIDILSRQRNRWQRGLADTLWRFRHIFLNPKFGAIGMFAFPYMVFVELLGPIIEVLAYVALIAATYLDLLNRELLVLFFIVGILFGSSMTVAAVILEEIHFSRYSKPREALTLVLTGLLESFGWRQWTSLWRLAGLRDFLLGNKAWGAMVRSGFGRSIETRASVSHVAAPLLGILLARGVLAYSVPVDPSLKLSRKLDSALHRKNVKKALIYARELAALYPRNHIYAARIAELEGELKNYAAEAEAWDTFMRLSPNADEACPRVGDAYALAGNSAGALDAQRRCLALDPKNTDRIFSLALAYERNSDRERAEKYYRMGLEINPTQVDCRVGLSRVRLSLGGATEAEKLAREVLSAKPEYVDALLALGLALTAEKQYSEANTVLEKARTLAPDYADVQTALAAIPREKTE